MSQTLLEQRINGVTLNLPNQRVVKMDAQRTRADLPMFECEETRERIQRILTYYCKNREVEYKQGMNEVLAPIVMAALLERKCMEDGVDEVFDRTVDSKLRTIGSNEAKTLMTSVSNAIVYQLFERMLSKVSHMSLLKDCKLHRQIGVFLFQFLTRIFGTDDEFISLQCSLRLFRLLLQYHAPDLCKSDWHNVHDWTTALIYVCDEHSFLQASFWISMISRPSYTRLHGFSPCSHIRSHPTC